MYKIITICHSLSGESFRGVHLFLKTLIQTFSPYRFAEIHILHGPEISRASFPEGSPIFLHPMQEKEGSNAIKWYLSELPFHSDDFVMHVDFRDAYFQRFPFDCLEESSSKLHVFAESSSHPLDQEKINLHWQNKLHPQGIPEFMRGKPVLCFGVAGAGRWRLFQKHIRLIIRSLLTRDYFFGMDQAVHTMLVHQNSENYILHTNEDGPVMHLHTQPPTVDSNLTIRTPKGIVPAVVHQYDRYPNLQKALFQRYQIP
jgi:hypothetical protein